MNEKQIQAKLKQTEERAPFLICLGAAFWVAIIVIALI